MERRSFLKAMSSGLAAGATGCHSGFLSKVTEPIEETEEELPEHLSVLGLAPSQPPVVIPPTKALNFNQPMHVQVTPPTKHHQTRTRVEKARNFAKTFDDDIFIDPDKIALLKSLNRKLWQVRKLVGYGHFNLIGFDELVRYCKNSSRIADLTHAELEFFDQIFHEDAKRYGFYGEKPIVKMTSNIPVRETIKIPHSGHYLYQGEPLQLYHKIRKELGSTLILTSGIRSVVKQMHLFLTKAIRVDGNLSKASRSLAPPGHSFHGIGDFDVGKVGFGVRNFTDKFAETDEYKKLIDSGYVKIRYTKDNTFGVRYEPWHIKVIV